MRLHLSNKAYEQLYGSQTKPEPSPEEQEARRKAEEAREQRHLAKQELRAGKVAARQGALDADTALDQAHDDILDAEEIIKTMLRRQEKDAEEHRIQVERAHKLCFQ